MSLLGVIEMRFSTEYGRYSSGDTPHCESRDSADFYFDRGTYDMPWRHRPSLPE